MMWGEGRHSGEYRDGCGFIWVHRQLSRLQRKIWLVEVSLSRKGSVADTAADTMKTIVEPSLGRASDLRREENATASQRFSLWQGSSLQTISVEVHPCCSSRSSSALVATAALSSTDDSDLPISSFSRHRKLAPEILTTILNRFKSPESA